MSPLLDNRRTKVSIPPILLLLLAPFVGDALGAEAVDDCRGGCVNAVVREIPSSARRPYSHENLSAFSYTQPFVPPLKYDHPYQGKYTVTRVSDGEMKVVCPLPSKGNVVLACAHLDPCNIYMLDNIALKGLGWNYDIVLRHELAHCNGWGADHPGIERPEE